MFATDCWFLHGFNLAGLKGNTGDSDEIGKIRSCPRNCYPRKVY